MADLVGGAHSGVGVLPLTGQRVVQNALDFIEEFFGETDELERRGTRGRDEWQRRLDRSRRPGYAKKVLRWVLLNCGGRSIDARGANRQKRNDERKK